MANFILGAVYMDIYTAVHLTYHENINSGQYCIKVLLKWMKNYKFIRWLYFWPFLNQVICLICFSLHRKLCSFLFQTRSECTAQKWSFPLRISSVNVTKSAIFSGIGHIYWRNSEWKILFFVQWWIVQLYNTTLLIRTTFILKDF